jgi:hypothetical protein
LAVRPVDLDDMDPGAGQVPREPSAIGPGALDTDPFDIAM